MEEGTTNGTVTDVNGKYSISVSAKSTLALSCIGYKEQKIRVGTKTVLNVDMVEESKMLDELVVVGYGVQRKSDVATSVASVKADEMKTFPAGNVADMLRGRAAGVNVTSSSGRPGSSFDHYSRFPFYQCGQCSFIYHRWFSFQCNGV